MKIWKRVVEARLRGDVAARTSTASYREHYRCNIFFFRVLMEKYGAGKMELHCVFVALKKA